MKTRWKRLTIGACDDNMELVTVLTTIHSSLGRHARAPETAFDVCEAGRVGAGIRRGNTGITLKVDVESRAKIDRVTELLAFDGVIAVEGVEPHIAVGIAGGLQVFEAQLVALRSRRILCCLLASLRS